MRLIRRHLPSKPIPRVRVGGGRPPRARRRLPLLAAAMVPAAIFCVPALAHASDGAQGCQGGGSAAVILLVFAIILGFSLIFDRLGSRKQRRLDAELKSQVPDETIPESVLDARLDALRAEDPGFSRVAMLEFVYGLWQETMQRLGQPGLDRLRPYYSGEMLRLLREDTPLPAGGRIGDVVVHGIRLEDLVRVEPEPPGDSAAAWRAIVHLDTSWRLKAPGEPAAYHGQLVTLEFERPTDVRSHPPGPFVVCCQACGAPLPHEDLGERCGHCGQDYTSTQFNWRCTRILRVTDEHPWLAEVVACGPVLSPGFELPARFSTSLFLRLTALEREEPEFRSRLRARTEEIFDGLNSGWNDDDLERLRQLVGERLLNSFRDRREDLRRRGQWNRRTDCRILSMELSRIERDDFLDAVTLRIKASCLDSTVKVKTGELVGGSERHPLRSCEYWTLTRLRETTAVAAEACPRCGVARGPVETAFCSHCGSRLFAMSGRWELAFIERVDGYLLGKPRAPGDQSSWRRL